jgi:hypothetical protein
MTDDFQLAGASVLLPHEDREDLLESHPRPEIGKVAAGIRDASFT